ncbi:MAG: hypothetical protein HKN67_06920 [Saprospiraceae bacterium]|nr:hypothetical protein [Saprospiraceae bacterium]NNK90282.1 hypothetical protein [Saprospiraceae bacterium]
MKKEQNTEVGICRISIASLRERPDHQSSLVSQVFFGERVIFLKRKNKNWFKIRCHWDGVIGWIDPKQFYFSDQFDKIISLDSSTFSLEYIHGLSSEKSTIPIVLGSNLYNCDGLTVKMPFGKFQYSGQIIDLKQSNFSRKLLVTIAKRYLHCPYLFGGRSITGTDDSGFIQVAFKLIGLNVPRFPFQIAKYGEDVGFLKEAMPGDIALFGPDAHTINHIGLVLEDEKILHANGRVKIDRLDHQGIYDLELKKYTFKLRSIRRLFSEIDY